jgi:pimeloyl-ACP methyl ester carboxylesterase|tara:strand:+ start:826 stop:1575 length:750 start_codon:yes stop_codon:yes gene_type:complete
LNKLVAKFLYERPSTKIAYQKISGSSPGIIFLGGFMSDMSGTKATEIYKFCKKNKKSFLRFDYLGHGMSSGNFEEGTIGKWKRNAIAILDRLTKGPQILVGSSMGAWIMMLVAQARPRRIRALVGLASAPDFTKQLLLKTLNKTQLTKLKNKGRIEIKSEYNSDPYVITKNLIDEGAKHCILGKKITINRPIRLLHGLKDKDVPPLFSLRLANNINAEDLTVTFTKNGDHRLSDKNSLRQILSTINSLS